MNKFPILCVLAAVAAFPQAQTPLTITQSAGSATGELRMQERRTNGQNYVGIKSPQSVAANTVWALPTADGTNGQCLTTDGAGQWSWGACGGQWTTTGSDIYYTTGNVGIGTTSPGAKLSVEAGNIGIDGNGSAQQFFGTAGNVAGTNTTGGVITVFGHAPNAQTNLVTPPFDGTNFVGAAGIITRGFSESSQYRGSLEFFTETANTPASRILITHDGNVGIGTTSPGGKLDVVGGRSFFAPASEPYAIGAKYVSTGGTVYFGATNGTATPDAQISNAGGSALMTLLNGGDVGIGTGSPATKLDVAGTVQAAASGVSVRMQPGSGIGDIGTFSNHPLGVYTDSAERWRWNAAGMFVPATHDTYDIGNLTTPLRVRGVYSKIVDTALAGGTGDYLQTRKIQLFDNTGSSTGASYWDLNVVMSGVGAGQNSYFYLRDNGGNTVWRADKIASGSPVATTTIYTDLLPDSTANARDLGKTGQRWDEINGASLGLTGAADITGNLSAAVINATGSPAYRVSGTTVINASREATFAGLTIATGAASGYVWTSDASGVGSWQAAGVASQWTTTGSDIYYTTGNVGIGTTSPLATLSVGAGSLSDANLSIQISTAGAGTERWLAINKNGGYGLLLGYQNGTGLGTGAFIRQITADPLYFLVNNTTFAQTILSNGNVGINNATPTYKLDVNGTMQVTGAATFGDGGDFTGNLSAAAATFTGLTVNTGAATVGYVWTATSTGGAGSWQVPSAAAILPVVDTQTLVKGSSDATKLLRIEVDGFTTATTRTLTPQNNSYTIAGTDISQTFTATQTFSASLAAGLTDTHDIGSSTRFRNIYGKAVNAESLEIANSTFVTTFWRHSLNSAATYRISSGSGGQIEMQMGTTSSTQSDVGFRGTLYPLSTSGSNGDLGFSGYPWRTLYLSSSAFMSGTQWMDSSRNLTNIGTATFGSAITANGGISTASGTNSTMYVGSGNLYLRTFSGANASCSGVTDGWAGIRTDTSELQVCIGGAVKKAGLL